MRSRTVEKKQSNTGIEKCLSHFRGTNEVQVALTIGTKFSVLLISGLYE